MYKKRLWLLLCSLALWSCQEGEIPDSGQDYFPIELGTFRLYDVHETTYFDKTESSENYQLRESFLDADTLDNTIVYLMRIERRDMVTAPWQPVETIRVQKTNKYLDYRQNNKSFIKLTFPVKPGISWDGNANNPDDEQMYEFRALETEEPFDNAPHIKVVISDLPANIVEQDQRFELYAQGLGLVERNFTQIEFCQQNCDGPNQPESGRIFVQRLVAHGSL